VNDRSVNKHAEYYKSIWIPRCRSSGSPGRQTSRTTCLIAAGTWSTTNRNTTADGGSMCSGLAVCVCLCVSGCLLVCVCVFVCECMCVEACVSVCLSVCVWLSACVHVLLHFCVNVLLCFCMSVFLCFCVCVCLFMINSTQQASDLEVPMNNSTHT
jgi:hypothetical protein